MKIVKAGYEILDPLNGKEILEKLERIARVCYKSEDKISENGETRGYSGADGKSPYSEGA